MDADDGDVRRPRATVSDYHMRVGLLKFSSNIFSLCSRARQELPLRPLRPGALGSEMMQSLPGEGHQLQLMMMKVCDAVAAEA